VTKVRLPNDGLHTVGLSAILSLMIAFGAIGLLQLPFVAPAEANPIAAGLVIEGPTVNDNGFNWSSYQGLLRAQSELGVVGKVYTSTSSADYGPNLQKCVNDGNTACISVGFGMADATMSKATANSSTKFAIVDFSWSSYPDNLRGITFASDEVGYLAGILAGRMTQSDVIGAVGGMRIPSVESYIGGFRNGARCTNPDVTVIVTHTNNFSDPVRGARAAQEMIAQGADVIFSVAGQTGDGAVLTATQSGKWGIGVDADQYVTLFISGTVAGSDKLLSSAMKRTDNAVFDTIADVVSGTFTSGTVLYDLAVDGVGLAPFHEAAPSVPQSVQDELEAARQGIISGTIDVNTPCGKSAGLVTDVGTLTDNGFNWSSYQGLLRAQNELGVAGKVYTSTTSADYTPNIQQCVDDANSLCIGVGFLTSNPIRNAAESNPGTYFATVDFAYDTYPDNLRGITFASDEAGYVAGTLAGLMTQSDVVGSIGGMSIPAVDLFVDGYRNGAQCANPGVTVMISYTNDFGNPSLGAQKAQAMIAQGADVIFPAAAWTGYGAVLTATQSGVWAIGVDTDYFYSVFGGGTVAGSDHLLSSAMKRMDNAVFDTITDAISGTFTSGTVLHDLEADGVGLAPFHDADPYVSPGVRSELERVRQGLISGTIDVGASCRFKAYLPLVTKN
jgi:basic membrane protein A